MKRSLLLAYVVVGMFFSVTVSVGTFYVLLPGSNSIQGTSVNDPLLNVQSAVDHVKVKDTLIVLNGLYPGSSSYRHN